MIEIGRIKEEDIEQVAELEKKTFSHPWSKEAFENAYTDPNACFVVARENDCIIGMCGLYNIVGDGEITNVVVDIKYRGRKIAKQMMLFLFQEGLKMGVTQYTLEVRKGNKEAIYLYESLCFKPEGLRKNFYTNPMEDAVIMWKRN